MISELPSHSTLSSAAADLRISESALSQAITQVEKAVGEHLCVRRKGRGLQLTPAGRHFAAQAKKIVHASEELILNPSQGRTSLRGPVHLGCFASLAPHLLPPILSEVRSLYPEIDLQLTAGTHDELLPQLEAGHLDAILAYDLHLPGGFTKRHLYSTQLEAVLPQDHPLTGQKSVSLADLADEDLMLYGTNPSTATVHTAFEAAGLKPKVVMTVPQMILARELVARGVGYTVQMSRPREHQLSLEGRPFAIRPIEPTAGSTAVVAVWPMGMRLTPRASAVLDIAAETSIF
ncbi:LysR family transcriptional regulator [Zhihengliuella salsuginis]|uniref:LysR family transcriptional regulator n=2 Tax=Zhihengliuella salsuginis TaxID=578222 RepID=A0ABQ3GC50_9MICC|nr:LysR family transcriptional regulator [Zhihengliuella salsuginis]